VTGHRGTASIRDVAHAAGVSHQTVSRVLNGHTSVSAPTRRRVLDAMDRLAYRPNRAARALAGGPVDSVTVLTSNTRLYGPASALEGIEEAARAAGFALGVRVIETAGPETVEDAVKRAVEPAGALIVVAYDRAGVAALQAVPPGVPVAALIETPAPEQEVDDLWVWIDDHEAARQATAYLLGLGHRTVHYASIPLSTGTSQRMAGWRSALASAGAPAPRPVKGGWGAASGYEAGKRLAKDPAVTAVLCGNDDIALGVMRAMYDAGRPVPESVSVVGFDDTPLAPYYFPPLTTVRQDFRALGKACFAKLLSSLNPAGPRQQARFPKAQLVVRESAGPPPGRAAYRAPGGLPGGTRIHTRKGTTMTQGKRKEHHP
jgi:DNA-binding LacI/PurR family transcriptional regulator